VTLCCEIVNWTRERHRAATLYATSITRAIATMTHRACYTSSYIPTSRQTLAKPNMTLGPTVRFHTHSASTPSNLLSRIVSPSPMRPAPLHSTPTPRLCRFHTTASRPRSPTQAVFSRANSHLETQLARCCEQQHRSTNTYSAGTPANGSVTDQLPPSERLP
jgi:hypothetical protein